jgi:hypothetical protein
MPFIKPHVHEVASYESLGGRYDVRFGRLHSFRETCLCGASRIVDYRDDAQARQTHEGAVELPAKGGRV